MAHISAHGRTKVETLKNEFKAAYGVGIRIYNGVKFADDSTTLARVRTDKTSKEWSPEGAIEINGKMLVGNVEKKFLDVLGVKVQIEDLQRNLADNGVTLTSLSGKSNAASTTNDVDVPTKKSNKTGLIAIIIVVVIVVVVLLSR